MTFGVCYRHDRRPWLQNQWEFVLSHFGVEESWIRRAPDSFESHHGSKKIRDGADLPAGRPLVVLAHPEGRVYRGETSLADFRHPADAVYLFGGDDETNDDLGGRRPNALVYVPATKYEMYSFVVCAVVLYDRMVKLG